MGAYKILTSDELFDIAENDISENHFKIAADFLKTAINDWPLLNLSEPKDFIKELKNELMAPLTFDNIDNYLNQLSTEYDAWKMESLSSVLEMFDLERKNNFDKTIELEIIIQKITQYYREQK